MYCISALRLPESFFSLCCRHVKSDGNTGANPNKTTAKKFGLLSCWFLSTTPVYIQQAYGPLMKTLLIFILLIGYYLHWADFHFIQAMDEGTLNTPIPKCRLYWSFLFGVVKQFCRFWIWAETDCKTPVEYGPQHNSTPPTPPPHSHTLSV
jgi:hypothetical protein